MSDLKSIPDGTKIIIDSNIFLYPALAHPVFQKSCTDFLKRLDKARNEAAIYEGVCW